MTFGDKWLHVILSNHKQWNLSGLNRFMNCWHELRKEPNNTFSQQDSGSYVR